MAARGVSAGARGRAGARGGAEWGLAGLAAAAEGARRRGGAGAAAAAAARPGAAAAAAAAAEQVREQFGAVTQFGSFCNAYDMDNEADELTGTWKKTIRVAVSGAAGQISNHLLFMLCSGNAFGRDQPIALHLLGSDNSKGALEGVAMELEDSLYPLLREVNISVEPEEAFLDADWALLIGAKPRGPGMERADLLDMNGQIFERQGKALEKVASRDCKVCVVGNPCNTNALIAMKNAPSIPKKNFHALTRLDENRARYQMAMKAGVFYASVTNTTIWGNHSTTQVPDFVNARIKTQSAEEVINDPEWFEEEFTPLVATRGGALIKKWGRSSAASTAVSIVDHIRALTTPTNEGDWFSMGVCTDGNPYGLPEDMIFSMPCRSTGDGDYTLVPEKEIKRTPWLDAKIAASVDELSKERGCVQHLFGEMGGVCEVTEDTMLPGEN